MSQTHASRQSIPLSDMHQLFPELVGELVMWAQVLVHAETIRARSIFNRKAPVEEVIQPGCSHNQSNR